MTILGFYTYLTRARRDLWAFLGTLPEEALSAHSIRGERFHCIKDLVMHIPVVEDSWLHEDIQADTPVWEGYPGHPAVFERPHYDGLPLATMLGYWAAVEASTLAYLDRLTPDELAREVRVMGASQSDPLYTVDEVLWHVMQHEVRHTAQIALLARNAGFAPPQLDLNRYSGRLA